MAPEPIGEALAVQRAADEVGFDWNGADEVWPKLFEEIDELRAAVSEGQHRMVDELGDLLFVILNLARHLKVDPAAALAQASRKFNRRFAHVQAGSARWSDLQGAERIVAMEALWREAKQLGL